MKKVKIVCVARDISPTRALTALSKELISLGHECDLYVGEGNGGQNLSPPEFPPCNAFMEDSIRDAVLILVGMSSSPELSLRELRALEKAESCGKKYGMFSDSRSCWQGRVWFNRFKPGADLLFVTTDEEVTSARKQFPKAVIVATSHPSHEGEDQPKFNRGEARKIFGTAANEWAVCLFGSKNEILNMELLNCVKQALSMLYIADPRLKIIYGPHPGDRVGRDKSWQFYKSVLPEAEIMDPSNVKMSQCLLGADLVLTVSSNVILECAYGRIPVVGLLTPEAVKMRGLDFGCLGFPEEEQQGIVKIVKYPEELAEDIFRRLLNCDRFPEIRSAQRANYPARPDTGKSVRLMVMAINGLLG